MDSRRKTARLSIEDIPEILKKPILFYNFEVVYSEIENLSPLGIGLLIDKNSVIKEGDIFYIKFASFESEFKCICVYSDENENSRSLGAYFTDPEDQKLIIKYI